MYIMKTSLLISFSFILTQGFLAASEEHLVSVLRFGAVADAKRVGETYIGTDNATAFNKCAAYCRKNGLTMLVPKGNYGVAATVWLTNPEIDGIKQASLTVIGSNRGAYMSQEYSANICVLKDFQPGRTVQIKKVDGRTVEEPYLVPVLGISNGRQVNIEGIGILCRRVDDYICGIAIGNITVMTSIRNCSIFGTYAGVVFPGIRPKATENVTEGNNDLLVIEQSSLYNKYNIVCAGTQPYACEYRNNRMVCANSIFTGKLITCEYGHSRGSHKFSSNLFGTFEHTPEQDTVYFDLDLNEMAIDSCHFESGWTRKKAEVVLRCQPQGGFPNYTGYLSFSNNIVTLSSEYENQSKYTPLIDVFSGGRPIFLANHITTASPIRIKADGAVFIANSFQLRAPNDKEIEDDPHFLLGKPGDIEKGYYDLNHFIQQGADIQFKVDSKTSLKKGQHYKIDYGRNAFEITDKGKEIIDKVKTNRLLLSYKVNDAAGIQFQAWGGSKLNPPHGWKSKNLTFIDNKVTYLDNQGRRMQKDLKSYFRE